MLPMMWFLEWVEKNQWIYLLLFCLGVVCAIISDFLLRKKIIENISNSDYYLEYGESSFKRYYVEQRRKDIVMLVFSCIVIIGFIIFYLYSYYLFASYNLYFHYQQNLLHFYILLRNIYHSSQVVFVFLLYLLQAINL